MNTRVLLFAGMLATAAIAFSGVFADITGVETMEPAAAHCQPDPGTGGGPCPDHVVCAVSSAVERVLTGEPGSCIH